MGTVQTRRSFLATLSLAGTAGLLVAPQALAAEGALETTTVRLVNDGSICIAPEYAAEDLLRAEGFTDIRYPEIAATAQVEAVGRGAIDFGSFLPFGRGILAIEAGLPVVMLAGIHSGCFELFA